MTKLPQRWTLLNTYPLNCLQTTHLVSCLPSPESGRNVIRMLESLYQTQTRNPPPFTNPHYLRIYSTNTSSVLLYQVYLYQLVIPHQNSIAVFPRTQSHAVVSRGAQGSRSLPFHVSRPIIMISFLPINTQTPVSRPQSNPAFNF
jgi:hypothetical protein